MTDLYCHSIRHHPMNVIEEMESINLTSRPSLLFIESIVGTCHYIAIIDSETHGKIGIHDLSVEFTATTTCKQIIQDAASVFTKDLFEY